MRHLAIFASGNGTNAEALFQYFAQRSDIRISLVVSNRQKAFVCQRAENHKIPLFLITRTTSTSELLQRLEAAGIDFIVLAGYLALIPPELIRRYPKQIINLHPALLPQFGGKGMYGDKVHAAVLASEAERSGITVHFVDDTYDTGQIVFQASCGIEPFDTPSTLAERIHQLEHRYLPLVVDLLCSK